MPSVLVKVEVEPDDVEAFAAAAGGMKANPIVLTPDELREILAGAGVG